MSKFDFISWINRNQLIEAKHKLEEYGLTTIESFQMDSSQFIKWFTDSSLNNNNLLKHKVIKSMQQACYLNNQLF